MKKLILQSIAFSLAACVLFAACKKEEETPAQSTETAVEDNNTAMAESDDVLAIAETEMNINFSNMRIDATQQIHENTHGATVTFTPKGTNATGSILIDFSTTGITSARDGKTRKGKILITFTGRYRVPGTTQTIIFDNYYVNGNKVEGTKVLTHKLENNIHSTTIQVTGGKITFVDNTVLEWSSQRIRNWNLKGTHLNLEDDEFSVSGTASGKSRDGKSFSALIPAATPLLWKVSCFAESRYVAVSGILKVTPEGVIERTVDYGNGNCDRDVTISAGNFSATITLKK